VINIFNTKKKSIAERKIAESSYSMSVMCIFSIYDPKFMSSRFDFSRRCFKKITTDYYTC
jgi:hypothetical protein